MSFRNIDMNYKTLTSHTSGLREHYHNGYEIIFISNGKSNFTIDDNVYTYDKNTILFLNDLEKHKMDLVDIPYSRYMIIIDTDYLDNHIKNPALLSIFKNSASKYYNGFEIDKDNIDYIKNIFESLENKFLAKEELWEMEFMSIFTILILFLYRNYTQYFPISFLDEKDSRILNIQQYIDKNYKNNISLDDLSSKFYLSKYYLAHTFKKITGFTIKQYILLKRISYAKNQLYFTNKSVTEIAIDSGFNSQSNFIRTFKQKEGTTPLQFRKFYN